MEDETCTEEILKLLAQLELLLKDSINSGIVSCRVHSIIQQIKGLL